jgi:hypothetical protein
MSTILVLSLNFAREISCGFAPAGASKMHGPILVCQHAEHATGVADAAPAVARGVCEVWRWLLQ